MRIPPVVSMGRVLEAKVLLELPCRLAPLWAVATLSWDVADVFASCALPRVTMVPPAQRLPRCALARVYTVEACARDLDVRFIPVNVTHTHAQNQSAAMILNINFPLRAVALSHSPRNHRCETVQSDSVCSRCSA